MQDVSTHDLNLKQLHKTGDKFLKHKDLESAKKCYQKVFAGLGGVDAALCLSLSLLSGEAGQLQPALIYARKALNLEPGNFKAWILLALLHREYGDVELAWGNLRIALDRNPQSPLTLNIAQSWAREDRDFRPIIQMVESFPDSLKKENFLNYLKSEFKKDL